MNKADLIEALAPRLGGRAAAALAVESMVDVVLREVAGGGSVGITGFGTFEKVDRAPRTGRNPHTGEAVPIAATSSPRFRPGSYFKAVVADPDRLPDDGLAGARVGSSDTAEADGRPSSPGRRTTRRGSGDKTRQGEAPSVRKTEGAVASRPEPGSRTTAAQATGAGSRAPQRRTGTSGSVKADRATPAKAPAAEPRKKPASGGRIVLGGEEITEGILSAKKAELARAKNDLLAGTGAKKGKKGKGGTGKGKDKGRKGKKAKKKS